MKRKDVLGLVDSFSPLDGFLCNVNELLSNRHEPVARRRKNPGEVVGQSVIKGHYGKW